MAESLDEVRKRVSRKYLGKAGIHGVGIRRAQNALCIYIERAADPEQQKLWEEIAQEVMPYSVVKVEAERPTIA